jgi:putative membrane protein
VGTRIIDLGLTAAPLLAGAGFILTGAGGVMASAAFYLRKKRALGFLAAALLVAGAGIWLLTAYLAYWGHLSSFNKPKAVAPAAATAPASQPKS